MNNLIITRLPTLVNVDKMNIAELRAQYKVLEGDAISQSKQLSDVCSALHTLSKVAHECSATLQALADSYDAGDQAAILLLVKQLADARRAKKAKVH